MYTWRSKAPTILGLLLLIALAGCGSAGPKIPTDEADVPRIRAEELKQLLDAGEDVVIVDSRSAAAYAESRIPGAVSLPLEETQARHGELREEAIIVTYCT